MATLEKVQRQIETLQHQADEMRRRKAASIIADIKALMAKHGLTTADIDDSGAMKRGASKAGRPAGKATARKSVARAQRPTAQGKGKLPAKYRNPKTGETWSGHARPPAWIKDVKDRTKFLIGPSAQSAVSGQTKSPKTVKKAAVQNGVKVVGHTATRAANGAALNAKGPAPRTYQNPKTGQTWSGHGRAPAWIKEVKDRTRFLVAESPVVAGSTQKTKRAPTPKKVAVKEAVAGKPNRSRRGLAAEKPIAAPKTLPVPNPPQAEVTAVL